MLSVLIPCLNEAEGMGRLETELFEALEKLGVDFEVILVDDGSTDSTWSDLTAMAERRPSLRLARHEGNRGIGASLKTGIEVARGDWLVFLDADLSFHPDHIAALLAKQRETDADCVSGSPMLGGMPGVPFIRRLPSLLMNAFYRGFLNLGLTSFTPMFRLYRTTDLREIRITSDGFQVSVEVLARLLKKGIKIAEVPVPLTVRKTGASKLRRGRELYAHAALAWRLLTGG